MRDDPYRQAHPAWEDYRTLGDELRRAERIALLRDVIRVGGEGLAVVLIFLGFLIIWPVILGGR